jgi:hypothetical protein
LEVKIVKIKNPEELNFIIGQSHFIKTVEDIYEAMVNAVPNAKFGVAFCEASADRLVRVEGTDENLKKLAAENAMNISAGHTFFLVMKDAYPVNVLGALRNVPEVCNIICATANPTEVVIAETEAGRGILGVIDGKTPLGIEDEKGAKWRKDFLRKIGYKK